VRQKSEIDTQLDKRRESERRRGEKKRRETVGKGEEEEWKKMIRIGHQKVNLRKTNLHKITRRETN
jgi:hypothetical protein